MMCVPSVLADNDVLEQGSTIGIRINTDRNGTIRNAFTTVLSSVGLKIDNNNSGYLLDINLTPLIISNVSNLVYVRFELNAELLDSNGRVLLPYTFNIHEGHTTRAQAEDRAFREAVIKINAEYRDLLSNITVIEPAQPVKQGSTIGIRINADRGGTIQSAFTSAISGAGLINSNNNSDYILNINVTVTPLTIPNNQNQFVQLDLIANLLDSNGRVLLPYTVSWRQGHVTQAQAEERAFREAAIKINAEYRNLLNGIIER
jgi:hypothetical protein